MSHFRSRSFHLHLFTRPAYRCDRCALVLVIPARPRFVLSGSWLGGSRISALRFFCLAPFGSSCDFDGFVLLLLQWMTCSGRGTQAAWSLCFKSSFSCFHSTAWMWRFLVFWLFGGLAVAFGCFLFGFACSAVE